MSTFIAIIALIYAISLGKKISRIEKVLLGGQALSQEQTQVSESSENDLSEASLAVDSDYNKSIDKDAFEQKFSAFTNWLTTDWPMKLGSLLLLIAFGWFVSYAFMNNWIGPMGRISFGLISGLVVVIVGFKFIKKYPDQGSVLLSLGSAVIMLSVFAGRISYDFFTPTSAALMMIAVVMFMATASAIYKKRAVAVLSLLFGGLVPVLAVSATPDVMNLFGYLLLLSFGTVCLVFFTGWRFLTPISLGIVALYSFPFFLAFGTDDNALKIFFAFAFATLYYVANLAGAFLHKKVSISDLLVAGANGLLLLIWIISLVNRDWISVSLSIVALAFILGTFLVYRFTSSVQSMIIYSSLALVYLATATAYELSGPALFIAYTLEIVAVSLLTAYLARSIRPGRMVSLLMVVPGIMSIHSILSRSWQGGVFHDDFFALLILALSFFVIWFGFNKIQKMIRADKDKNELNLIYPIIGSVYVAILLWLSLEAAIINNDTAHMIALVVYTLVGIYFYIRGKIDQKHYESVAGSAILGFVTVRLLFVEVWDMDISGKIITFFLIGVLFISSAFFSKIKKTTK